MTFARAVAALAALLTALLLQATLIGPATMSVPASLPAVLVGAVAIWTGPATGMLLGFVTGLVADLGSEHPAGVLALCWLVLGLTLGRLANPHRNLISALVLTACGAAASSLVAGWALAMVHLPETGRHIDSLLDPVITFVPAVLGNLVLGLVVVPATRAALKTDLLRDRKPPLPSWRPEPPVIRRG